MTTLPTLALPVKKMKSKGRASSAPISSRPPVTMLTASGAKYCGISRASSAATVGVVLAGFRITVLPAASAAMAGSSSSRMGALNGPITRQLP